jgi:hypothetical protein
MQPSSKHCAYLEINWRLARLFRHPIEHLQATTLRTAVMNASTIDTSFFNGSHGLRGMATTKASGTKPHLLACAAPTLWRSLQWCTGVRDGDHVALNTVSDGDLDAARFSAMDWCGKISGAHGGSLEGVRRSKVVPGVHGGAVHQVSSFSYSWFLLWRVGWRSIWFLLPRSTPGCVGLSGLSSGRHKKILKPGHTANSRHRCCCQLSPSCHASASASASPCLMA